MALMVFQQYECSYCHRAVHLKMIKTSLELNSKLKESIKNIYTEICICVCSVMSHSLQPHGL